MSRIVVLGPTTLQLGIDLPVETLETFKKHKNMPDTT